jgi:hypothetical protein
MAALAAAQVVDALAARLAPLPATSGRVYTSRAWPLDVLPAWRVTAEDETAQSVTVPEGVHQHSLAVAAAGVVRTVADLDDAMNNLARDGLALLFAPPVPYGLQLDGIGREMAGDGEAAVGQITLRLRAQFFTDPAAPDTIIG